MAVSLRSVTCIRERPTSVRDAVNPPSFDMGFSSVAVFSNLTVVMLLSSSAQEAVRSVTWFRRDSFADRVPWSWLTKVA